MILINNVISIDKQKDIKDLLLGNDFPWYFIRNITKQNLINNRIFKPALFHNFIKDSYITSNFYNDLIENLFLSACNKVGIIPTNLINCRAFLQFPLSEYIVENQMVDDFHVDLTSEHKVFLYYVKNGDGHTIITDDTLIDNTNIKEIDLKNISHRKIVPTQGNLIHFDGKYFHSAEQPRFDTRCVINFNFV